MNTFKKFILFAFLVCCGTFASAQTGETPAYISLPVTNTVQTGYDLGVYSDNAGKPGTLQCHTGGVVAANPANNVVTFALSGCPVEAFGSQIWLGAVTGNNSITLNATTTQCPGTTVQPVWTTTAQASTILPTTFPASNPADSTHSCYDIQVTFSDGSTCGILQGTSPDNGNGNFALATPCKVPTSAPVWYHTGEKVTTACTPSTTSTTADPGTVTINRATSANGPWTSLSTTVPPACPYSDTTVQAATTYFYQAYYTQDGQISTTGSNVASISVPGIQPAPPTVTPFAGAPPAPTGLTVTLQ